MMFLVFLGVIGLAAIAATIRAILVDGYRAVPVRTSAPTRGTGPAGAGREELG